MSEIKETAEIKSLSELLKMKLAVPSYQRPYKWTKKNVADLLEDISKAVDRNQDGSGFKYRIGTIILHWNTKKNVVIVISQQATRYSPDNGTIEMVECCR